MLKSGPSMPLFGKASRVNPVEVVKSLRDSLDTLDKSQDRKKVEKVIRAHSRISIKWWGGIPMAPWHHRK